MKKIYTIILTALLSLIGINASAFTMFVDIDNTANLASLQTWWSGTTTTIDISGKMPLTVEFPDNEMSYFYVTPKTGCFITEFIVKDEDGNVLHDKTGAWKTMKELWIKPEYDYGTLYIKTSDKQPLDAKVTVNLNGNPSNVSLFFGGQRQIALKSGSQEIAFTSATESTVYLMPVGVTKFYEVMHNGQEVEARGAADESGNITYQYALSIKNGSVIDINVEYPEIYRNVAIKVNEGLNDFVQSVTADGKPVNNWTDFSVRMGTRLVIKANTYDYDVETFTVNGRNTSFTVGSWDIIVEKEDIDIQMTGSIIERPYSAKIITYNWNYLGNESKGFYSYDLRRADNKSITLNSGENAITFNEKEVPLSLRLYADNQDDVKVAVNGDPQTCDIGAVYTLDIKDGDIIQIGLATELPNITGIDTVTQNSKTETDDCYNLTGQKAANGIKGIVIVNGKKIVR